MIVNKRCSPGPSRAILARSLALGLLCVPGLARANSAEIFGAGSRGGGMGDAVSAFSAGPFAAFYNPAGVAGGARGRVVYSATGYAAWLRVRSASQDIQNPYEFSIGLTVPVPFQGRLANRIWLGVLLSAHPDILARVIAHLPTDPFYPYFENRTQRLVLLPTLAVRVLDSARRGRLLIGVGLNVFAGLEGVIVGTEGASRALEARVSQSLSGIFALTAGAQYAYRWLRLGFSYRQQFSMPFRVESYNFVAGTDLNLNIDAEGLFSPHTFVLGLGVVPRGGRFAAGLDVSYALWRLYRGPFVGVQSVLPLVGSLTGDVPRIAFRDAVGVRAGLEYRASLPKGMTLPLRFGLGFESSPVPDQPGRTNMLDGHKLVVSAGIGLDLGKLLGRRVWVGLHLRAHVILPRTFEKRILAGSTECPAPVLDGGPDDGLIDEVPCDRTDDTTLGFQTSNPGYPRLRASGVVLSGSFTLGFDLGRAR